MPSSNYLYHFTSDKSTLKSIFQEKFRIYYSVENYKWLKDHIDIDASFLLGDIEQEEKDQNVGLIEDVNKLAFPVVCFSDIPIHLAKSHRELYGDYALVFDKEWGIRRGLNPVLYIEDNSDLAATFQKFYHQVRQIDDNNEEYIYVNTFNKIFQFLKPYEGEFEKGSKYFKNYRFYNEREWRFVPKGDYTKFITESRLDELDKTYRNHLNFDFEELKYVLVKEEKDLRDIKKYLSRTSFKGEVLLIENAEEHLK